MNRAKSLTELLYIYILKNNLDNNLKPYNFLYFPYLKWKTYNYIDCSCCKKLTKKIYKCQLCENYYYCNNCWDDYTYHCFYCRKDHCFICNVKRRACKNCYI